MIVADASPLIILARSQLIEPFRPITGPLVTTPLVLAECLADPARPGARAIEAACATGLLRIEPADWTGPAPPGLAPGELSAIALACQLRSPILIDERLGLRAATAAGLRVTGSIGVLLVAKQRGLVAEVGPILARWRAFGYHLSNELLRATLARAGESA
jgi:predicted nucleic acid-binding protein